MSEENNAAEAVETPTVESLQASLAKAEAKIVDLKKAETKEIPPIKEDENNKSFWKEEVETMIKEALKEKAIINQEDQYRENQQETNSASIWNEDPVTGSWWFKTLSIDDYSSLTPIAQREYIKNSIDKTGETKFL